MRVLVTSIGVRSHFYPLVPLAWALRAAGHDVRVAVQPAIVDEVVRAGLPAVQVGGGADLMTGLKQDLGKPAAAEGKRAAPTLDQIAVVHVRTAEAIAADLVPFAEHWRPDLVLADPAAFVAPVVAAAVGAPLVLHTWGPMPPQLWADINTEQQVRANWPEVLVKYFDQHDVPLGPDYAARVVDPCPDPLLAEVMPHRLPIRHVPYNGSAVAPAWLDQPVDRPRVCVTWGTTTGEFMGAQGFQVPQILDALGKLDVEVVAALRREDWELLGDEQEHVRLVDSMPLSMLLPTCDAIINQGGPGTVLAAAVNGLPQLIVPNYSAQPLGAELLAATGAGRSLQPDQLSADVVADTVSELLSGPTARAAAGKLRDEMLAQPSPADVVSELESLVRSA